MWGLLFSWRMPKLKGVGPFLAWRKTRSLVIFLFVCLCQRACYGPTFPGRHFGGHFASAFLEICLLFFCQILFCAGIIIGLSLVVSCTCFLQEGEPEQCSCTGVPGGRRAEEDRPESCILEVYVHRWIRAREGPGTGWQLPLRLRAWSQRLGWDLRELGDWRSRTSWILLYLAIANTHEYIYILVIFADDSKKGMLLLNNARIESVHRSLELHGAERTAC